MTSPEMVAQSRFLCITYFSIGIPIRWLAGKTHELKDYPVGLPPEKQWCARSMGRVLDTLYAAVKEIIKSPSLYLCEDYMMNIFSEFALELPPFAEYLHHTFVDRRIMLKNTLTGLRVAHLSLARKELFRPWKKTNMQSTARMLDLVKVSMKTLRAEFEDRKKATYYNLSISGDRRSWKGSKKEDRIRTRGCHATNDIAESTLGGLTRGVQLGSNVSMSRAGAQSDAKRRKDYYRPIGASKGKNKDAKDEKGELVICFFQCTIQILY